MQKVLVTGASGFVGSHVVQALQAHGFAVRCLVRPTSRLDFLQPATVELARGDVMDVAALEAAVEGMDAVVHCAGVTQARSRHEFFRINEGGTRNLLAACSRRKNRIAKFVHISSLAALGPSTTGCALTEEATPRPVSDYGESKLASQRLAESFMQELPIAILIPPAVYGPGDDGFLICFKWVRRGFMVLLGRDARRISLIYAKDLAEAAAAVLRHPQAVGRSYLVEDGCVQTWESLGNAIGCAMGRTPRKICLPVALARSAGTIGDFGSKITGKAGFLNSQKMRELVQRAWVCSSQRLRGELGFRPRYPLDLGIRETLSWYTGHQWL